MFQTPNQPLSIFAILIKSLKLYQHSFSATFPIITWFSLLLFVSYSAPTYFLALGLRSDTQLLLSFALILLCTPLFMLAFTLRITTAYRQDAPLRQPILKKTLAKYFTTLLANLAISLFAAALVILDIQFLGGHRLLMIPAFIIVVPIILYMNIIADGETSPILAFKKSHQLVWKFWWRHLANVLLFSLVYLGLVIGAIHALLWIELLIVIMFQSILDRNLVEILNSIFIVLIIILPAFITPLIYSFFVVQYHDLKMRHQQ